VGTFALHVTDEQLDDNPDKGVNYLIAQALGVRLYRLKGGGLEVHRIKPDGKDYAFNIGTCSSAYSE